eukprot:SAG31_NODE_359_length_17032_cov_11.017894_4_plen_41_part_00
MISLMLARGLEEMDGRMSGLFSNRFSAATDAFADSARRKS